MNKVPLDCNPFRLPSIDDLVPSIDILLAKHALFNSGSAVVELKLSKDDAGWVLLWGDQSEFNTPIPSTCRCPLPVTIRVADRGWGAVVATTARDLIDYYVPNEVTR